MHVCVGGLQRNMCHAGIWHVMGKQPHIGYIMLKGLKDSILTSLSLNPLHFLEDIQIEHNIHILYIYSVPDVEGSNMQLR